MSDQSLRTYHRGLVAAALLFGLLGAAPSAVQAQRSPSDVVILGQNVMAVVG
ncbi:MAG: hypothetical protein ABEK75_04945 [Salinibacter sp.]